MSDSAFIVGETTAEKEALIDKMQEQIGELLRRAQELSRARGHIAKLNEGLALQQSEFDRDNTGFRNDIEELGRSISAGRDLIEQQDLELSRIDADQTDCDGEISELERKIEEVRCERTTVEETSEYEAGDLASELSERESEIVQLKQRMSEMKTEKNGAKKRSILQKLENERLKAVNAWRDELVEQKENNIANLSAKAKALKVKEKEARANAWQLERERHVAENEVASMMRFNDASLSSMPKTEARTASRRMELAKALGYGPGFESIDELLAFVSARQGEVTRLRRADAKSERQFRKVCAKCEELRQTAVESKRNDEESIKRVAPAQREAERKAIEVQTLKKTMERQRRRLSVVAVVERANSAMNARLRDITLTERGEEDITSVLTLIVLVITTMRWQKLTGTRKQFARDSRNWWWLNAGRVKHATGLEIGDKFRRLTAELASTKDELRSVMSNVDDTMRLIERSGESAATHVRGRDQTRSEIMKLKKESRALRRRLTIGVSPDEHDRALETLKAVKGKIRAAKTAARSGESEVRELQLAVSRVRYRLHA